MTDAGHLAEIDTQLAALRPKLTIIDPLYLSARGANLADLYAIGEVLEAPQRQCQEYGSSLLLVTHFNRKQGAGADRIVGAGPAEWGRVLLSGTVKSRHTDPTTKATTVITELDIIGGEIPDQTLRIQRRTWADDPDDLNSPLHVVTTITDDAEETMSMTPDTDLTPAARKLLEALQAVGPASGSRLVDWIAQKHGHGLKRETVSRTMGVLAKRGLVESVDDPMPFKPTKWRLRDDADSPVTHVTSRDPRSRDVCAPPSKGSHHTDHMSHVISTGDEPEESERVDRALEEGL
jgi:hypothetical protein